jgi:hypothetical protein
MLYRTLLLNALVIVQLMYARQNPAIRVKVGDAVVNGSSLVPYKNLWQLSLISPDGKENPDAGEWSDRLEFVTFDGRKYMQRTQVGSFKKAGQVVATTETVNVFDPKTLAPVSRSFSKHLQKGNDELTKLTFQPTSIHMEHTKDGATNSEDAKLEYPVFDFYGGLYGLLIATFPLEKGYAATLPSVDEEHPTTSWVTFSVSGKEMTNAGGRGKVDAWVVESDTNLGPMKFWISKNAPYIIRLEYKAKDNGYTWIYKMI